MDQLSHVSGGIADDRIRFWGFEPHQLEDTMTSHSRAMRAPRRSPKVEHHVRHTQADIYVGTSFRYWLTGFQTGDLSYWERAFAISAQSFGLSAARDVCRDFSQWVRMLSEGSRRDLQVSAPMCPTFGHDECVAMALIAAYQNKGCPALQVCAMTRLGCEPRHDVCKLSEHLAQQLAEFDHRLSDDAIGHVVRYAGFGPVASVRQVC
jgi:hypothetical protein